MTLKVRGNDPPACKTILRILLVKSRVLFVESKKKKWGEWHDTFSGPSCRGCAVCALSIASIYDYERNLWMTEEESESSTSPILRLRIYMAHLNNILQQLDAKHWPLIPAIYCILNSSVRSGDYTEGHRELNLDESKPYVNCSYPLSALRTWITSVFKSHSY